MRLAPVTAIIPVYNRAHTVARALDSVAAQIVAPCELIVVDDGSTDATSEILSEWISAAARPFSVRMFRTENRGVSAARNLAAREARGEWLAFLDSDDEWLPEKLMRQMELASDFPLIHAEEIWIRNGVRVNAMKKHAKSGGRIFLRCVDLCCISPSAAVVRADLFRELGGFREDFPVCEDYELWLRVCARHEVGFVADPLVVKYGGHEDQLSRRFKAMDYYRCKALVPFLGDLGLPAEERAYVASDLARRCDILLAGYAKHGRTEHVAEVRSWQAAAEAAVGAANRSIARSSAGMIST